MYSSCGLGESEHAFHSLNPTYSYTTWAVSATSENTKQISIPITAISASFKNGAY